MQFHFNYVTFFQLLSLVNSASHARDLPLSHTHPLANPKKFVSGAKETGIESQSLFGDEHDVGVDPSPFGGEC